MIDRIELIAGHVAATRSPADVSNGQQLTDPRLMAAVEKEGRCNF